MMAWTLLKKCSRMLWLAIRGPAGPTVGCDGLVAELKKLPKAEGVTEILVPGELEDKTEAERRAGGIPLPAGTVQKLEIAGRRFGVAVPAMR